MQASMCNQDNEKLNNNICLGLLAHVDAGKTTLSEAMLYLTNSIRKIGRVDKKDTFLDTHELEKQRGITIFSKQALLSFKGKNITLIDTPGHVDFSCEMERTLQVLDCAILLISAPDGIQGHTRTLWRLLDRYHIPTYIFVNKMDQADFNSTELLTTLKSGLNDSIIDFESTDNDIFFDSLATCDEKMLDMYLEKNYISDELIVENIKKRKVFPCLFGSALKMQGIEKLLEIIDKYSRPNQYRADFGARVYKISYDDLGNRLTFIKVTGGSIKVRQVINYNENSEKISQIRNYSGNKFIATDEAVAGQVCAITGLSKSYIGQGLGFEEEVIAPLLEPVLTYKVVLPKEVDATVMLKNLRRLEEEDPKLHFVWDEVYSEIKVLVMGNMQLDVLKSQVKSRFNIDIAFGEGNIVYKETITNIAEGVGHFEPLRHYAEVHLLFEPGVRGSGLVFETRLSEDILDKNWQRLILTHLHEKQHRGVLTGSAITDMKITLVNGRAHIKHTEGGDFREATYRAVRHGLKMADSVLLEPYYDFELDIPDKMIGRAMSDLEKMHAIFSQPLIEDSFAKIIGSLPVSCLKDYPNDVTAYTRGEGRISFNFKGYDVCHNEQEVIDDINYDSESDILNPTGSVFCAHGAGFIVPYEQVYDYMHLEGSLIQKQNKEEEYVINDTTSNAGIDRIDNEEIDKIISKTYYSNSQTKGAGNQRTDTQKNYIYSRKWNDKAKDNNQVKRTELPEKVNMKYVQKKDNYLLVDGYNIIFAWPKLKELANENIDGARGRLMDILCNYQALKKCNLILVFDAYRVERHNTEIIDYHNIHVVYTKEAETADQYIEKFAHENKKKYDITVATSDGLEQIIIRGQGCKLLSAREFLDEIMQTEKNLRENFIDNQPKERNYLLDIARYL